MPQNIRGIKRKMIGDKYQCMSNNHIKEARKEIIPRAKRRKEKKNSKEFQDKVLFFHPFG